MNKYVIGDNWGKIILNDKTEITFVHEQEECEIVYADLRVLDYTSFAKDLSLKYDNLKIEIIEKYGFKINGYRIPCYNEQNGWCNDSIEVYLKKPKEKQKYLFGAFKMYQYHIR